MVSANWLGSDVLLFLLIIALIFYVVPFIVVFFILSQQIHLPQNFHRRDAFPALTPPQQAALGEMEALGFAAVLPYALNEGTTEYPGLLLRHSTLPVFARLNFKPQVNMGYLTTLYSFTKDGTILTTFLRAFPRSTFPKARWFTSFECTPADFLRDHEARLAHVEIETPDNDEAFSRLSSLSRDFFAWQCEHGVFIRGKAGDWLPSFSSVMRVMWTSFRARRKTRPRYKSVVSQPLYQSAYYSECYREHELLKERKRARPLIRLGILLFSIALSMGAWSLNHDWKFAAILLTVLFIHESGHAILMHLFGYRNMSMFFVPMLGALVTGSIKNISVGRQALILFGGPVPGLLVGSWFLCHPYVMESSEYLRIAVLMAFFVNVFNLLPLGPLDGGRLVEISLLSRWPYAMFVFAVLSLAAITALIIWLHSTSWLIVLFLLLYVRGQWNVVRMRGAWKGQTGHIEDLPALFELARQKLGNKPFDRQYYFVKALFNPPVKAKALPRETLAILGTLLLLWAASGYSFYQWRKMLDSWKGFERAYISYEDSHLRANARAQASAYQSLARLAQQLDEHDPRQVDVQVVRAQRMPLPQRLEEMENILRQHRIGHYYNTQAIQGLYDWNKHLEKGEAQ